MKTPKEILQEVWHYDVFRPLQEDIIKATLNGQDVLALMPTGGGKSICFQVPALVKEGLAIVVSPLIALMKDQVFQLKKRGVYAEAIFTGMSRKEVDIILDNCIYGPVKLLYVSPERLQTNIFLERVQKMNINLLVVDEAHCISQWGYDFRPSYLKIAEFREIVPKINVLALTATATRQVKKDIQEKLHFKNNSIVFQKSFERKNLSYSIRKVEDKEKKLIEVLKKVSGSAIVYVETRKNTIKISNFLKSKKISADYYHGGLSNEIRSKKQDAWIKNNIRVIVATNAFGMGIDKSDVRLVIHMDLPSTLEAYYQEAGRAGRDEKNAFALIICQERDMEDLMHKIVQKYPDKHFLVRVYQALANYYQVAKGSHEKSYDFDIHDFSQKYNFDVRETYQALKRLEDEEIILFNESFYNPSKFYVAVSSEELYKFQIAYVAFEPLIKGLLRLYGGEVFSHFVEVSEKQLARLLQTTEEQIRLQLNKLSNYKILEYHPRKDLPQITLLHARYEANSLPIDMNHILMLKKRDMEKASAVVDYVNEQNMCRTRVLLNYFGEEYDKKCHICDICIKERQEIDEKAFEEKIISLLSQKDCTPEELLAGISTSEETPFLNTIQTLLDEGKIHLKDSGKLTYK